MIAVPLIVVWVTSQVLYFRLPTLAALVLSLALSWICAVLAARIWERRSKTAEVSFSELMIWSWYRLKKAERRIERGLRTAATADTHDEQLQVLHELADALESKDPYTRGHSRRVELHSFNTGVVMGLPLEGIEALRMSASLHDVGKIRIPNTILHKAGPLTEDERTLVQKHPVLGASIVAIIHDEQIVEAVRHHHERWDGGGYPAGLAGTKIPLFSRVIAVADSYDAIRSNRSYRTGGSRDETVQVLMAESGHQFDPEVVDAFLATLPARGRAVAAWTSLATGPGALWRYLARLFQRFGSTALAPVMGAAGTAVILGTSTLLAPGIPAVSAMESVSPPTPSPSASVRTDPRRASEARARQRATALARADRRQARREERRARQRQERRAMRRQEAVVAAGSTTGSGSATSPTSSTSTSESPTTSSGSGAEQGSDGDPNDQGRDCNQGSRERSKGYRTHCG